MCSRRDHRHVVAAEHGIGSEDGQIFYLRLSDEQTINHVYHAGCASEPGRLDGWAPSKPRIGRLQLEIDLRIELHVSRGLDARWGQPCAVGHVILVEGRDDVGVGDVVDVDPDLRARPAVAEDLRDTEIEVVATVRIQRAWAYQVDCDVSRREAAA